MLGGHIPLYVLKLEKSSISRTFEIFLMFWAWGGNELIIDTSLLYNL